MDDKNEKHLFSRELLSIALPVTLQCLFQSSFSVIDQVMTGQLGSASIAGIGMAGKFISLFSVLIAAITTAAGIMIAQYIGKKDDRQVGKSFYINLCLPLTVNMLVSAFLRCAEAASMPLYTSIAAAVLNTCLNYILIFGKLGFNAMGYRGAAWASVLAQVLGCMLLCLLFAKMYREKEWRFYFSLSCAENGTKDISGKQDVHWWKQYAGIILPILVCEFFWSLGENVYAGIYGHIGTKAYAAMTLTNPVQAITIGALSGVSSAAGIMIGKSLGAGKYEKAYEEAKKMMMCGLVGSLALSVVLVLGSSYYVKIFNVEESVRRMAVSLLLVYALVSPVKVQNMILGGGIIRSGGKTKYVMAIDLIGTWLFGVPLGLLTAFVWCMPIPTVYFILSMEECVRLGISLVVYRQKKWMQSLDAAHTIT